MVPLGQKAGTVCVQEAMNDLSARLFGADSTTSGGSGLRARTALLVGGGLVLAVAAGYAIATGGGFVFASRSFLFAGGAAARALAGRV